MFWVHHHVPDHGCHVPAMLLYAQVGKNTGGQCMDALQKLKNINII